MNYLNNSSCNGDSSLQLNNVEILYTKVQRVYMKPQHKEERQRELRVNVEIHAGISPVCRKSLCVLLADDDDPCFLYSLFITEDDFKVLKSQQGLLVDFDNFATQLIYLLEQCQIPSTTSIMKTPPKFLLLLAEESGEWVFKLVETNNFKHLCHLSLTISPASDSDLKTHMAMKIKQLKETLIQRNRDTLGLEARLNDLSSKVETKTRELEQLEQKYAMEKSQMQLSSSEQISLEKDRFAKARLEWQCQTEKEKIEAERRHTDIVKELHTELAELRTQNLTYKDKISLLEATNIEQFKQLQNVEKELNVVQRDLSLLRTQNAKLDTDYHEKDKMVNSLRTKVAVLEQELKDKGLLITKHTEMFKTAKEQKQQLEELLNEKEGQVQRKQNSLRNLSDELVKANEILTKLQNELASTKSKLKLRTSIALEQERLLDTKQKEVGQLETKMEGLIKETKDAKMEVANLKEQVKALQGQLEEKEKIIKNNDNVISWLNRRLADTQSPLQNVTTSAPITVPSTIQLTLPRTNKYISSKYETRTPAPITVQSGLPLRNPIVQNPNINQTSRPTARSTAVGNNIDSTIGISTFNKGGHISSTSTPLERINSLNKLPGNVGTGSSSVPATENNNMAVPTNNGTKNKGMSSNFQGGLRRTGFTDKPILPSAYFPKTLH
ncbi:spindle assembly abnormal protein 6 homolog [Ceratina calcarata]|uniref:Spindle assembly abnormal protein 6 homolog n=1 Tax=Ceratina calcarata TaxID=156304 RepID=A0AAJ7NFC5_9HYME|nr:spindle assembly abnormal protein 6 homolog [Ceratina calcarata]